MRVPASRVDGAQVATPPLRAMGLEVCVPSVKVTAPVGERPPERVAVKVKVVPTVPDPGGPLKDRLGVAFETVTLVPLEVAGLFWPSPT